jgi:pimeloyl-ACP methyl ester carboxylesterase
MRVRRALTATAVAAGLMAGATGPASGAAPAPLAWADCPGAARLDPRQRCALLTVPRDYAQPGGATIEVALSRIESAQPGLRRGILVYNPGGPGSSGLNGPTRLAAALPQAVLDRYDLVGFDPRGVGSSAPVSCALAPPDLDVLKFIPYPAHDLDIAANVAYASRAATGCAAASGALLPHVTTANTARDVDRIRAALGEPKVSYLGYSYGTYLGAVYATLFPQRTDRFVLDSNIHPRRIWRETFAAWGYAVEVAFDGFARFAAARDAVYGLGATPAAVHAKVVAMALELEREPYVHPSGAVIGGDAFRELIRNEGLRNDRAFPALAELLALIDARAAAGAAAAPADRGDDARIATLLDALGADAAPATDPPVFPTPPADNPFAAPWAVVCGDAEWPRSPAFYQAAVQAQDALFPLHGRAAANIWPCAFWPFAPREPAVEIGPLRDGAALVVQSVRDPATPLDGAVALRATLGSRARLVTVEDGAHVVAFNAINSCADAHAASFLATGRLPADSWCRRDAPLPATARGAVAEPLAGAGLLP